MSRILLCISVWVGVAAASPSPLPPLAVPGPGVDERPPPPAEPPTPSLELLRPLGPTAIAESTDSPDRLSDQTALRPPASQTPGGSDLPHLIPLPPAVYSGAITAGLWATAHLAKRFARRGRRGTIAP
jgi:hypothetical protein